MFPFALLTLAPGLLLALNVPRDREAKKELDRLQGKWTIVKAEYLFKMGDTIHIPLVIQGNRIMGGETEDYSFQIDPTKKPKAVDLKCRLGGRDLVIHGIYSLEKDTLKVCFAVLIGPCGIFSVDDRPSRFVVQAKPPQILLTLKRGGS